MTVLLHSATVKISPGLIIKHLMILIILIVPNFFLALKSHVMRCNIAADRCRYVTKGLLVLGEIAADGEH